MNNNKRIKKRSKKMKQRRKRIKKRIKRDDYISELTIFMHYQWMVSNT